MIAVADGRDITWAEYFYWLYYNASQVENFFQSAASYYGLSCKWGDAIEEGGDQSYAAYVPQAAELQLKQYLAITGLAKSSGLVLSDEAETALAEERQSYMTSLCGENGTEADFEAALAQQYLPLEMFDGLSRLNYEYQENFTNLYGQDGANISDEETLKYLEDGGYISANHILFTAVDLSTGEALDEAVVAEKKALADEVYAELSAIEDRQQLVSRFAELKEQYCEDTGKTAYPDGYVFTAGTMDSAFEDACLALEDYGLSQPVESAYGYHIILRLPNDAQRTVSYSDSGTALSARSLCANEAYAKQLQEYSDGMELKYADGFEAPDLLGFIK